MAKTFEKSGLYILINYSSSISAEDEPSVKLIVCKKGRRRSIDKFEMQMRIHKLSNEFSLILSICIKKPPS